MRRNKRVADSAIYADRGGRGMATSSPAGRRYIKLEVHSWWDDSTSRVHVTSNDPDLGPDGLSTNLRPGTQAERAAKRALAKHGKPAG